MRKPSLLTTIMNELKAECKKMEEIIRRAKDADSGRMELLEDGVAEFVRRLSRKLLQTGVQRTYPKVGHGAYPCACGNAMRFVRERHVRMVSTWGEVKIRKTYFHCRHCRSGYAPENDAYGLTGGDYTARARQEIVREGIVCVSFAEAQRELKRYGIPASVETVRKMTEATGHEVRRRQRSGKLPVKPAEATDGQVYASADALKVNTHEGWKDLKLAAVYDQSRASVRYASHLGKPSALAEPLRRQAAALGVKEAAEVVAIADGAPWIWNLMETCFPGAEGMVDFYHASQHLGACAREVFDEGSPEGKAWLDRMCRDLKERGGDWVCGVLRDWIGALSRRKRKSVKAVLRYMEPRRDKMRYPEFQSRGLDIGSGPIESACKNVIARRLKGPGMRWDVSNVRAMSALRCLRHSDNWDAVDHLIAAG